MITILLTILVFLVILAYLVQYVSSYEVMKIKGITNKKDKLLAFIPIYGYFHTKKLPFLVKGYDESNFKYVYSLEQLSKKTGFLALVLLVVFIILIPLSVIVYLSVGNSLLRTL